MAFRVCAAHDLAPRKHSGSNAEELTKPSSFVALIDISGLNSRMEGASPDRKRSLEPIRQHNAKKGKKGLENSGKVMHREKLEIPSLDRRIVI